MYLFELMHDKFYEVISAIKTIEESPASSRIDLCKGRIKIYRCGKVIRIDLTPPKE